MGEYLATLAWTVFFYLCTFGLLTSAEIFFGREPMTVADRARGLRIWALMIPAQIIVTLAATGALRAAGIGPLVVLPVELGPLTPVAATLAGFLLADLAFYWGHRAQHRFFWRWHRVHHSIENLSAINSYHHWSEPFFNALFVVLPMTMIDLSAGGIAFLATILSVQPYFIHSPTRLHLGPLSKLIADNRFHRIHHSTDPDHHDRNFGAFTPLWDWLFRTAYFPAPAEWPRVGVVGFREPRTIREWSAQPLMHLNRELGGTAAAAVERGP